MHQNQIETIYIAEYNKMPISNIGKLDKEIN